MTGATLRWRDDGSIELRVNGVFVMDDVETRSERALARIALDLGARDVLIGGLGLGFTLRALLKSPDVRHVVVAELQPEIVAWMRDGTIPGADLLDDVRTEVVIDDVRAVVAARPLSSLDAIVLDVDNGPDFLVRDTNAEIYRTDFLATCAARLRPGGTLCIWSMGESAELTVALGATFAHVTERSVPVRLQGRDERYWIFTASSPG
jgi:spermidine synthase